MSDASGIPVSEASGIRVFGVAEFRAAEGVEDWRALGDGAHVRYRCGGLREALGFAAAVIGAWPDGVRAPEVDLRPRSVSLRLPEQDADPEAGGEGAFVVETDLPVARMAQRIARERGLEPDPASLRSFQIAVASAPGVDVQPFWEAVLGSVPISGGDSRDPHEHGPRVWFHDIEHGRPGRGRTHIDVYLPDEVAEDVVTAALAAGGRIADSSRAPVWWTLASPDNHGVDVAPWPDRG